MDEATLAALRVGANALLDLAFAVAVGALASALLLARAGGAWRAAREAPALRALGGAAALALLADLAGLWVQAMTMADAGPLEALGEARIIVVSTGLGHAWLAGAICLVLLLVARLGLRRGDTDLRAIAVFAAAGFALARGGGGHSGAHGFGVGALLMAVHLLATAGWSGLVLVAAVALPSTEAGAAPDAAWIRGLSTTATVALALVAATGVAIGWRATGGRVAPLASGPWGFLLDAKLVLVGGAALLGGFNRFVAMPPLLAALALAHDAPAAAAQRRFARVLRVEAVLLAAALVVAAVLANAEPPA